ncbi:MAG: hypothetical protein EON91_03680 [Brevundimonas sp.]|uniref:sensor histidine kinase n=1 Tax=Brevundimonas sp. TaxID=1871086 RepID=UPI0011F5931A|nr:histidine kinase [Brevundimonas sp.]RZJ18870.1 MAG: hypothetical protein EON91_03680 [Brevundimonas sp.]
MIRSESIEETKALSGTSGLVAIQRWVTAPFEISPEPRAALLLSAVLWVFVALLTSMLSVLAGYARAIGEYGTIAFGLVTGVAVAGALFVIFRAMARRPAWLAMVGIISAVIAAGIIQMVADYSGQFVIHAFTPTTMPDYSPPSLAKVALVYMSIYATNAALFWVTFANRRVREQHLLLVEGETAALRSELRVLRLQLNPHFMFNALSALSSLILSGRNADADRMTQNLSEFLRATIDIDAGQDVSLAEELSILDAYLAVESVRFGDKLILDVDCAPEVAGAMVPNLLLQPLVENAMKYAVQPSMGPVSVRIIARRKVDRLILSVVDGGAILPRSGALPRPGAGVGLNAVRARVALRFGETAAFVAGPAGAGFRAEIDIPLILADGI